MTHSENKHFEWNTIYKIGGAAAIGAVLVGLAEIAITFLPGGNTQQGTVLDWFQLFQANAFMGLRDLGLLNIFLNTLAIPIFFALYAAHRQDRHRPYAALAVLIAFLGIGTFYATNRAFAVWALSQQYTAASSAAQRATLEAAGQALLSVGQSHTAGTFLSFFLTEAAGVMISWVMGRSRLFGKAAAYTGVFGFGALAVFEILSSFVAGLSAVMMILAMFGGLLSMAWYLLIARRLFQLGQESIERSSI